MRNYEYEEDLDILYVNNNLDKEKVEKWLKIGAEPTDKVRILLGKAGILPAVDTSVLTKRKPKKEVKATAVKQAEVKKKNSKVQAVVKPVREIKQLRNEKLNKAVSAKGRSTFGGRKSTSK